MRRLRRLSVSRTLFWPHSIASVPWSPNQLVAVRVVQKEVPQEVMPDPTSTNNPKEDIAPDVNNKDTPLMTSVMLIKKQKNNNYRYILERFFYFRLFLFFLGVNGRVGDDDLFAEKF
eukprot:PhF_6_TR19080/c0_g1_i1/m.28056